jgi:hypothetical protein
MKGGQTRDGWKDVTKPTGDFRDFANAPRNNVALITTLLLRYVQFPTIQHDGLETFSKN